MNAKRAPTAQDIQDIERELLERHEREQAPRRELHVMVTSGKTQEEIRTSAVVAEMRRVDAENIAYLKSVIETYGWPDAARFSRKASFAAFLILQHSDGAELKGMVLPCMEADVKAGRLEASAYALLYDRYQLEINRPQRYGSQIAYNAQGDPEAERLEDPEHVDERRKEVGLEPLAVYLKRFAKKNRPRTTLR